MTQFKKWLLKVWGCIEPKRKIIVFDADTPPERLKSKHLHLANEDGEDWAVALRCPCGCGDRLELMLIPEAKPRWRLETNAKGHPSLKPSVSRKTKCKSHFWVKNGRIRWCD